MKHRRFTCFVFLMLPLLGLQPGFSQGSQSRVTGTIAAEPGEKLPSELAVKIRAARIPGRKPDVPEAVVKCPVGKLGELSCELPATLLDLSIQAEGFVPHNRWAVRLDLDSLQGPDPGSGGRHGPSHPSISGYADFRQGRHGKAGSSAIRF